MTEAEWTTMVARLQAANGGALTAAELERLAPSLAEIAAGLTALGEWLAWESEPATVQRAVEVGGDE